MRAGGRTTHLVGRRAVLRQVRRAAVRVNLPLGAALAEVPAAVRRLRLHPIREREDLGKLINVRVGVHLRATRRAPLSVPEGRDQGFNC